MAMITINGNSFDPIAEPTPVPPLDLSQSNYILIQTDPSLTDERRAELAGLGVTILEYLPRYSYLCRYEKDLQSIRTLPYISWAEEYRSDLKLPPGLSDGAEPKEVDIVFQNNVNPEDLREAVAAAANVDPAKLNLGRDKARVTVQPKYLSAVAKIDDVRHIEEVRPPMLLNDVAREILGLLSVNGNGGTPFEGEGQLVVVADTGFNNGRTENDQVHQAFRSSDNAEPRVIKLYPLGRPANAELGLAGNSNDPVGHGTHVAGSVLGDGTFSGSVKIRGTAPKARLIVQSLLDENNKLKLPLDLRDLFLTPYLNDGARIHNNSWGSLPSDNTSDQQAKEVDDFVFNHRDFVICCAAGNEGNDVLKTGSVAPKSITSPGTAKNCITVGATESRRSFPTTYGQKFSPHFPIGSPFHGNVMANDPESVAAISSRGPTQDGRIKPDVVAPGTFILSAKSIAKQPNDFGWADGGDEFIFHGGTSMATPLVAGCAALVREFLDEVHQIKDPSAALVKALIINGAQPLNRIGVAPVLIGIPNPDEGFGRVNIPATVGPFPEGTSLTLKDEPAGEDTGLKEREIRGLMIALNPQTTLLKVTLVWTDPPGEHLQNDLDLIVRAANGEERHGNKPPGAIDFDRANNVEQITWKGVPAGEARITVICARLTPPSLSQKYALVIRTA
jgi:serine protease AprX